MSIEVQAHDTEANWNTATNFIPRRGQIIVYDADENYGFERFKIGDGITPVTNLPFSINIYVQPTEPTNPTVGALWLDTSYVSEIMAEGAWF